MLGMTVGLYVRMFYILLLCPALLASGVLTLTIDSQLGTSMEDCFERISIGEQLTRDGIYRNVSELTTVECEHICKQDKQCQSYDYGVGAKGNATCELSNLDEKEIKEKNLFQKNPDYDVYVRRILCEQSPPVPIEKPFDGEGPEHKPVIRPTDDEAKRPLADDLNSYETSRPQPSYNRPYPDYNQNNDRPDDYNSFRPENDRPPSYGAHRPQEIPYRPYKNTSRPDLYDQLYFQDHRRPRPENWRPDPYHPPLPGDEVQDIYGQTNRPRPVQDKPQYQYIIRPNRKPSYRPNDEYTRPKPDYPYSQNSEPIRPNKPYVPTKPYDKPSYTYTDQYASNYGNSHDNSIHVEIYDPPRPYRPNVDERPYHGAGNTGQSYGQNYGYNSFSAQNSYSQNQAQYGSSSWSNGYYDPKPNKPAYNPSNQNEDVGYGSTPYKPKPTKIQSSYNSQFSQNSYDQALHQESYNSQFISGQASNNQGYGNGNSNQASNYGQNQYRPSQSNQYDSKPGGYDNQISNSQNKPFNQNSNNYNQNSYDQSSGYGNSQNQLYGSQQSHQQSINKRPDNQYNHVQTGYGNDIPNKYEPQNSDSYNSQNNYGTSQSNNYGSQSSYGNQASSTASQNNNQYGQQSGYGNQASTTSSSNNGYGAQSGYVVLHKMVMTPQNGYGNDNLQNGGNQASNSYGVSQSNQYTSQSQNSQSQYEATQSGYGNKYSSFDNQNYYGSHLGYGIHNLYGIKPGSGNDPNQNYQPIITNKEPYGVYRRPIQEKPQNYGNQDEDNGYKKPGQDSIPGYDRDKLDVKPVYEPAKDKINSQGYLSGPSSDFVTSKPVAVSNNGYERDPLPDILSYKGKKICSILLLYTYDFKN
ncbi:unnamed protein product, partial [Brenthis ino]